MAELDLRFIGTGNAFAPGGSCWNGFVLEGRYLFEAPPQALQSLNAMGVDANDLDAVILSHHHGDHFLGLPFLFLQWKALNRTRPVRIIGPENTRKLAVEIGEHVYPWLFETDFEVEWEEVTHGRRSTVGALSLTSIGVKHDRRLSGSLGFEIGLAGRRIGYTGDSAMCDAVLDLARGSQVLISECASVDEDIPTHMNLRDDIPLVREAMQSDARLILTHLGPGVTAGRLPNTEVARDFGVYRI